MDSSDPTLSCEKARLKKAYWEGWGAGYAEDWHTYRNPYVKDTEPELYQKWEDGFHEGRGDAIYSWGC
jgi:hypothetical protein